MAKQTSRVNRFLNVLLRSPFHWLASSKIMLISVVGRKTGRCYTTPVNYVLHDQTVLVISRLGRTWWQNLGNDTPVKLWLRGKECPGQAHLLKDPEKVAATLRVMHPNMRAEKIAQRTASRVAIWIDTNSA